MHLVDPTLHSAGLIDGRDETADPISNGHELADSRPKGGITCVPVPLLRNESESLAIERLRCLDRQFRPPYSFVRYNCVGYTRDLFGMAGLGYPDLPNAGIGGGYFIPRPAEVAERRRTALETCDGYVAWFQGALRALENGEPLTEAQVRRLPDVREAGDDLKLQFALSAARGGNPENAAAVRRTTQEFGDSGRFSSAALYLETRHGKVRVKPRFRKLIQSMLTELSAEARQRLAADYPGLIPLLAFSEGD